jgi:hypothetical protein
MNPAAVTEVESLKDRVEAIVAQHLDRRAAEWVVRIASRMWLRTEPENLLEAQLLGLTQGLQPLLEKLLGAELAHGISERVLRGTPAGRR